MPRTKDTFLPRWQLLTDAQRRFLLAAYKIDSHSPHNDGFNSILPELKWRTVGVMCGMNAAESDDVVRTLSESRLIDISDPEARKFVLLARTEIRHLLDARRRRRWNWIGLIAFVLAALAGALSHR